MSQDYSPDIANAEAQLREGIGDVRRLAHDYGVLPQQIGDSARGDPDRECGEADED